MAKKAAKADGDMIDNLKIDSKLISTLEKTYGDISRSGRDVRDATKGRHIIPISPAHDMALGGGIPEGSWVLISGDEKTGKAQPLSSTVYTPCGPTTMGELSIGDSVCTPDGQTAKIDAIHEHGVIDTYKVTFFDGSYTYCGGDHVWQLTKRTSKSWDKGILYNISTKQLVESGVVFRAKGEIRAKWTVALPQPLYMEKQYIPIKPYLLGCLIGDGCLKNKYSVTFTTADAEILSVLEEESQDLGTHLVKASLNKPNGYGYRFNNAGESLVPKLKELELYGLGSHSKFIPDVYKYNSVEVRTRIIQGLMDTDGSADGAGAEYCTASIKLGKDFKEVCESLGYIVTMNKRYTSYDKKKQFLSYRLYIRGDVSKLFALKRKINKIHERSKPKLQRSIRDIKRVKSQKCRCITLNNLSGLYLTDNCIVTHNSSSCLSLIKNAQKPEHGARHTLYLDTEGRIKSMLLDGIIGLDLDMITIISSDDPPLPAEEFLKIAESYMKDNDNLIVVIDSISSLIPARDLAEDMSGERRPGLPKLLSNFTKRLSGIVPRKNHIVMMVTHFIANLGAVGNAPKYVADGGTKIRYQADTMLEVSYTQGWEDSDKNQLGQIVHWKIGCSAAGGKPRTQYTSYLRYGHGIDCEFEIVAEAVNLSIIDKSGSWLSYGETKFQGMAKFADALRADPLLKTEIETKIKELLC